MKSSSSHLQLDSDLSEISISFRCTSVTKIWCSTCRSLLFLSIKGIYMHISIFALIILTVVDFCAAHNTTNKICYFLKMQCNQFQYQNIRS